MKYFRFGLWFQLALHVLRMLGSISRSNLEVIYLFIAL